MNSGNKYHRRIYGLKKYEYIQANYIYIDVYSVLSAYDITSPGLQHCIKKLLCAGIRDKGNRLQDLQEARDALDRAIEDYCREEENDGKKVP